MQAESVSSKKLPTGALLSGVAALVCLGLLMVAFMQAASPYVTLAEARKTPGDSLHLAGQMIKGSVSTDFRNGQLRFSVKDTNGERVDVVYDGAPPTNISEATRVVAVGKLEGERFHANELLVKCPSKYEGESKG